MQNVLSRILTLSVFVLFLAAPVQAEDAASLNENVEALIDAGMTVEQIAGFIHQSRPYSEYTPNTLTAMYISVGLELQENNISVYNLADIDISSLSYEDLIALKKQIDTAIIQSDEWKQVTVPVGTYVVGEDIPAGDYTVAYEGRIQSCVYIYPNAKAVGGNNFTFHILNSTLMENASIGKLSLTDGQVVDIQYGEVVFTPYIGLGF